jgi:glycosyltransferase involved in cell wall biosynthesis
LRRLTVVQLLPALHAGGVERSTLEIAAALVAAGHRSIVISAGGRLVRALEAGGSEHLPMPIGRKSLLSALPTAFALRRTLRGLRPDIVHARSRLPAWFARFALRGLKPRPRFVTTVHGMNSPGAYSGVMTSGEEVICVSASVRAHVLQQWPRTPPERLVVIERGIDPAAYPRDFEPTSLWRAAFAREHPRLQGGRLLLMPGRGTRLKGHPDAIALLATLRADGIDARLWMPGIRQEGREHYVEELAVLAEQRGVRQQVVFDSPRSDLREAYAVADVVLQLSNQPEAFGRTVIEALAVGRPVLGWDHGGVGELLHALYPAGAVAPGDHAALAARARELLAEPPPPPVTIPQTLAAMQAATLELYDRLVR